MKRIFRCLLAGILTLFFSDLFFVSISLHPIPGKSTYFGIRFEEYWQILIFIGIVLGIIKFVFGPVVAFFNFFLKWFTFGMSFFFLNIFFIWLIDFLFAELTISGTISLLATTLIFSLFNKLFKI